MPPLIALFICLVFAWWLIVQDTKRRVGVSAAIWIPWLWITIIASRPVCIWLGFGMPDSDDPSEGAPLDRLIYLILIVAGLIVLSRRHLSLTELIADNKWLFILLLYWGISVVWSDYSFVSLKRWIKEIGNIVMVLIVLSEVDGPEATKALFVRCAYLLIPLSVTFIKYFPALGRTFNIWTWRYTYVGVTQTKNALGGLVLISSLFLLWDLLDARDRRVWFSRRQILVSWLPLGCCAWLLHMAHSATSLVLVVLGCSLIVALRREWFRRQLRWLVVYTVIGVIAFFIANTVVRLDYLFLHAIGRDPTLTDRTEIWHTVLQEPINPFFGTGFYSFWMGPRAQRIWESFKGINQAHNGYLETYLNGGLIAVCLLVIWILYVNVHIRKRIVAGDRFAQLRFVIWIVAILYNCTEAIFDRLALTWIALLTAAIRYRPLNEVEWQDTGELMSAEDRLTLCEEAEVAS